MDICKENFTIAGVPAVLYGETAKKLLIYLHGRMGCKEEAASLVPHFCPKGYQILAVDLPEHGSRRPEHGERQKDPTDKKECLPWVVIPEWTAMLAWVRERYEHISFCAVSMSAWFLMRSFRDERFEKAYFISPIVDMRRVIEDMMARAGVTASDLGWKQFIPTDEGMLIWDYYAYAAYQPINRWDTPTEVLYAKGDVLQPQSTIEAYANRFGWHVTVIDGQHWISLDTPALQDWLER